MNDISRKTEDLIQTEDKGIFGQVKPVCNSASYKIQTKYGVLDRNFPTSELVPLTSTNQFRFWRYQYRLPIKE